MTNNERLLKVLMDREWHASAELVKKVSHRFSHNVMELRRAGYIIIGKKFASGLWRFRLAKLAPRGA